MDALKFAIELELDGEKYYTEQAELNKDNHLYNICLMLAEDERNHARILKNKASGMIYTLKASDVLPKSKSIFNDIKENKNDIGQIKSQLDFYRMASDKEKQSIELYKGLLSNAEDNHEKELFEYLIEQEEQHHEVLENLSVLLRHAEEWVESAEFGLRKEY